MKIWKHQFWHILLLTIMLIVIYYLIGRDTELLKGSLWNIPTKSWFILAILFPIIHQGYVLICWRTELYFKSLTNFFGKKAFSVYKIFFVLLILSRPISITLLAIANANANTVQVNTVFSWLLSFILLFPFIYLIYSIRMYFGYDRAFGIDHFYPEEYKNKPFIKEGIFKYTPNAMYIFGFFMLWIPGILLQSKAAFLVALFNHLYIWVHYYFTELPDIKVIYNKK